MACALVCFAIAVLYLLKDNVKVEAMADLVERFCDRRYRVRQQVFGLYRVRLSRWPLCPEHRRQANPSRLHSGSKFLMSAPALAVTGVLLARGHRRVFAVSLPAKPDGENSRPYTVKVALVTMIVAIALPCFGHQGDVRMCTESLAAQLAARPSSMRRPDERSPSASSFPPANLPPLTPTQFEQMGRSYIQSNGDKLFLSLNTNPVELPALLPALRHVFCDAVSFRTDKLRERLPSLESLDGLMYKTACLAFAGLAMLLITGAIWANESWGRPWGFDSKETGALVAWLTYAAFLHTRISRGWSGSSSAYFAVVGFLLVIFTYLGVSYLLPGLHSYA